MDTTRGDLDSIKSNYRGLGVVVKSMGDPGGVLVNPAVRGKGVRKKGLIGQVSKWLRNWCW